MVWQMSSPGKSGDFLRLSLQTDSSLVPGDVEEHPPQMKRENMQEDRRDEECPLKIKKKKEECIKRSCYITLN